jgi:hypothetical protein
MLDEPEDDGSPLLDHLLSIERQTGERPQILIDAPPLPATCEDLWRTFSELHSCRGSNGFGPNRISYVDIDAFQRVSGVKLSAWERDAIRRADAAYMKRQADRKPNS